MHMAEAVGFEPTNELPRYRISSAGRYDHFDTLPYFDVEKPLRSGHNRHAVRIAMTTSIHFRILMLKSHCGVGIIGTLCVLP